MRRKEVSKRLKSVAEVRASLQAHRASVGQLLDVRPAAQATGIVSQPYFDHLDSELSTIESTLVTAEDQHTVKLVRIARLRRQSFALSSALFEKQAASRQILTGLYGSQSGFELAATAGDTPRNPQRLAEQVDQTVKLLRLPELAPPSERVSGVTIDFTALADDLESSRQEMLQVLTNRQRTIKEADATRALVKAALEEFNTVFSWATTNIENTFRLAGENELAERVRTSRRRVTRRQGEDGGEETSPGEESSPNEEQPPTEEEETLRGADEADPTPTESAESAVAADA